MSNPAYTPDMPQTFRCANHPEREGIGICVNCRAVVCVECSTKVDRMNYCIRCLRAAAPQRKEIADNPSQEALAGIPLLVAGFVVTTGVFFVLGILLAWFRQGVG